MTDVQAYALWIVLCVIAYYVLMVVPRGRRSDPIIGDRVNDEIRNKWERKI